LTVGFSHRQKPTVRKALTVATRYAILVVNADGVAILRSILPNSRRVPARPY
jgi:hypothetical protein